MFSRFTEKAIQAIMLAQEEAKRLRHNYVGTEHILLGIIGEGDNVVIKSLLDMGFTIEQIKLAIEEHLELGNLTSDYVNIPFTQQAKQVLTYAWDEARKLGHNYVNVEHLFLSIFRDPTNVAARVLAELGINLNSFKDTLLKQLGDKLLISQKHHHSTIPTPTLDLFGRDLTLMAKEDKLDPVIGRDKEIERIIQILSRRTKNNPVLTGEAGVGKTAIIEGLAQKIEKEDIPDKLKDKRLVSLDLGLVVAGTKYRGEFEDRIKKIMDEVRKAKNIILFVDELHTIIGTGGSEGSMDAANMFKPALARGELQCIGATTLDEYRKHIEGDAALERRFQSVLVEEPTKEETVNILKGIRERYEEFHNVKILDEALTAAVNLSVHYITERFLPDKAIDVIDEAASRVMLFASSLPKEIKDLLKDQEQIQIEKKLLEKKGKSKELTLLLAKEAILAKKIKEIPEAHLRYSKKEVSEIEVTEVVSNWTGVPVNKLNEAESQRLMEMDSILKQRIVGQNEAIAALVKAVKRSKIGLKNPKRPIGSFLFLGPSGVGKSELAKQLAIFLFGKEDALIRIDMSEYMEKHTVSRLVGSPPGYVGYNEGGQLTEPIRRKPYSVVLFDEIEKASPDILNILLQILEDGRLTDATGKQVNFKNTIIIMTSNVGSKLIEKQTSFGFKQTDDQEKSEYDSMKTKLNEELKKEFKPEFLNRIDDAIIFRSLSKVDLTEIVAIFLNELKKRLVERQIYITYDKKEEIFLADKGYVEKQGARPLRKAIENYFEDVLADRLLTENLRSNIEVKAEVKDDKIDFTITNVKPKGAILEVKTKEKPTTKKKVLDPVVSK
ncbi:MAG: ATP-dependent Clp protease ATP-binding subunit [Candidatus Margulisiibacteriota bacterium]|jgi:ATP-dependent Clp protease ATP-binding subunit ClpC